MTISHRTLLQQALDALTNCLSEHGHRCNRCDSEIDEGGKLSAALREALAEPGPEPVAWLWQSFDGKLNVWVGDPKDGGSRVFPVYAAPAAPAAPVPDGWVMVPREPTEEMIQAAAGAWGESESGLHNAFAAALRGGIAAAPAAPVVLDLKHCACEFDGDTCVTQCKLHAAHVDAIHEWAERAKAAEANMLAAPVVPLTDEQLAKIAVEDEFLLYCDQDSFNEIARAIEAALGITGGSNAT